jgi:hypothetical protein
MNENGLEMKGVYSAVCIAGNVSEFQFKSWACQQNTINKEGSITLFMLHSLAFSTLPKS